MTFLYDITAMTKRSLKLNLRNFDSLITAVVLPVMILLAFVYIFGGAISTDGSYTDYIVPGIVVLGAGQVAAGVAVSISTMKQKGILNRFKTMNISQSSVLFGEMNITLMKNLLSAILVVGVSMLIGFKPQLTLVNVILLALFLLLFASVIIWIGFYIGLIASPEAAASFSMMLIFLPYLSSGFVPVATMPAWLQVVSKYSPFTPTTEVIRGLLMNSLKMNDVLVAIVWLSALLGVAVLITLIKYKKLTVRP